MKYTAYLRTSETGENGLRYFGYTTDSKTRRGYTYTKDNNTWSKHLQQYPDYTTLTLYETDSQFDLTKFCINYSLKNGIWNNPGYANQMMENGLPGTTKKKFRSKQMNINVQKINVGRKPSPETRAKMSLSNSGELNGFYGKQHSPEDIIKMSQPRASVTGNLNPFAGKTHTIESKDKAREKLKGFVAARDLRTGLNTRVTQEEFNKHSYLVGTTSKKPNYTSNEPKAKGDTRG